MTVSKTHHDDIGHDDYADAVSKPQTASHGSHRPKGRSKIQVDVENPSTVLQRKRTSVEIKDATVDDSLQLGNGVVASSGDEHPEYFPVRDMDVVAPRIRKRRALKAFLALAVVTLAIAVACVYLVGPLSAGESSGKSSSRESQLQTAYDNLGIIDLESFYGLTLEQTSEKLGTNFEYEATQQPPSGSAASTYAIFVNQIELEDEWSSAPTRVVLMLDDAGKAVGVGYKVSMDRAGFAPEMFSDLVGTDEALKATLEAAGISDVVTTFTAPDPQTYTTYLDPSAENKRVSRYSTTFTGATGYTNLPDTWSVTFTYDYTADDGNGGKLLLDDPVRTINIVLD